MVMEIPGYYYDSDKKKYFKLAPHAESKSHSYNATAVKRREKDQENYNKRKRHLIAINPYRPSISDLLNVRTRIGLLSNQSLLNSVKYYELSNLKLKYTSNYDNRQPFEKITDFKNGLLISGTEDMIHVSTQTVKGEQSLCLESAVSGSLTKEYSELRYIASLDNSIIRTWSGFMDELSEFEIFNYDDNSIISVKGRSIECFTSAFLNRFRNRIVIGGDKFVHSYDLTNLKSRDLKLRSTALCLDMWEDNSYVIGFRNGCIGLFDERSKTMPYKSSQMIEVIKPQKSNSIINIKKIDDTKLVSSSLSSSLCLYDVRKGFHETLQEYSSTKDVEDVFGENMGLLDAENFIIQTKNSCEIFNVNNEVPIMSIPPSDASIGDDGVIRDFCCKNTIKGSLELYLAYGNSIKLFG